MRRVLAFSLLLLALAGPFGSTGEGFTANWAALDTAPGSARALAAGYWWGTDELGRDAWVRLCLGLRGSLAVSAMAVGLSAALGLFLGASLGTLRGFAGTVAARVVDILASMPLTLLALVLVSSLGRSLWSVAAVLGLLGCVPVARAVRVAIVAAQAEAHYLVAGLHGATSFEQFRWTLLPAMGSACQTSSVLLLPQVLIAEGTLGFLGLSIPDPGISLGGLLVESAGRATQAPLAVVGPSVLVFLLLLVVRPR
ncbi:MAG: hypothetical protein RJB26_145 [Pseudomonadota bacterium]